MAEAPEPLVAGDVTPPTRSSLSERPRYFNAWRSPALRALISASTLAGMAHAGLTVMTGFLIYSSTKSFAALGVAEAAQGGASIVVALLAGLAFDAWSPHRRQFVLRLAFALQAAIFLVAASLMSVMQIPPVALVAVAVLAQVARSIQRTFVLALIPDLATPRDLVGANAVYFVLGIVSSAISPALAGALIAALTPWSACVVLALLPIVAFVIVGAGVKGEVAPAEAALAAMRIARDRLGWRLWATLGIVVTITVLTGIIGGFLDGLLSELLPESSSNASAGSIALFRGLPALVGRLAALLALGAWPPLDRVRPYALAAGGAGMFFATAIALAGRVPAPELRVVSIVLFAGMAGSRSIFQILALTMFQVLAPEGRRGRVLGILEASRLT